YALIHKGHGPSGFSLQAADHAADFFRSLGRSLRQGTHLSRHHGETATMLACPRCLNRCIEGEQICLRGDITDDPYELVDFRHTTIEQPHTLRRMLDHAADRLSTLAHSLKALAGAYHHFIHGLLHFFSRH